MGDLAKMIEWHYTDPVDAYERRESPQGHVYYWPAGTGLDFTHTAPDTSPIAAASSTSRSAPWHPTSSA